VGYPFNGYVIDALDMLCCFSSAFGGNRIICFFRMMIFVIVILFLFCIFYVDTMILSFQVLVLKWVHWSNDNAIVRI